MFLIQENNILREASTIYEEERETALDNQRIVLDEIEKINTRLFEEGHIW